ncbi:MAG: MBOAT family O-acyltransferase [Aminipila sp.]
MIFSIISNYVFGLMVDAFKRNNSNKSLKLSLVLCVIVNLSILGFFKYSDFLIQNVNMIIGTSFDMLELPLPIGISFYTFQAMSYIIDLYRDKVKVQRNLIAFGTYVALFPQLIAGPIVRFSSIEEQLITRTIDMAGFAYGVRRFILGLAKKVLIANNLGLLWENISALDSSNLTVISAWLGAIAFTLQIYFDFSGYSDMAIGLGRMFGFHFPENFNYPYISTSITEFWRRWHISLSSWFKEYVYIPLGGNRSGAKRQIVNIFIVWGLTGLWHGASWNFVIWGLYFAVLLVIEKTFMANKLDAMRLKFPGIGNILTHIYAMFFVVISWVIFAIEDLSVLKVYLKCLLGINEAGFIDNQAIYFINSNIILLIIGMVGCTQIPVKVFGYIKQKYNLGNSILGMVIANMWMIILFLACFAYIVASTYNPFLYFRF